jgi:hypothetical protein
MKTRSQIVAQQRQLLSFLPHVRAQFGNIPGVEIVGLGAKERRRRILDEWAFRFYVSKKRPLKDIPKDQQIPDRIFGIQTDVISHFEKVSLVCETSVLSVDTKGIATKVYAEGFPYATITSTMTNLPAMVRLAYWHGERLTMPLWD